MLFSPVMPTLGDEGDLILCDFSQYALGIRAGLTLDKSIHPGFQSDKSSYRVLFRFDGAPTWNKYFTPEVGDTMSWAVLLGERA